MLAARAKAVRPVFLETLDYLPNDAVRDQVRETLAAMEEIVGPPESTERAQGRLVERIFALEQAKREVVPARSIEPWTTVRRWLDGVEVAPARLCLRFPSELLRESCDEEPSLNFVVPIRRTSRVAPSTQR